MAYVYVHLREDTGEPFYVGMGKTPNRIWDLRHRNRFHKNVANKHGVRGWGVGYNMSWEVAQWWEIRWIKALRAAGYRLVNLTDGGDGVSGMVVSVETREKMAAAKRGKKQSPELVAKRVAQSIGKTRSPETVEKIAAANRGKKRTPEQVRAMAERVKRTMQDQEMRKRLSEANKGKKPSEETRLKLRAANIGKSLSEDHKRKIGAANKGKKSALGMRRSDETRAKMSLAAKLREERKRSLRAQ